MSPKILLLDIETAPAKVFAWGLYDQNIGTNQIVDDGYVLCWCAKWLGSKRTLSDSLINYPEYFKENPRCDKKISESIWKLVDEADIVVTHNGNDFDIRWINTMFVKNGLKPVSPFKSIDTLVAVKKKFRFISNKLDFICRKLDLGHKISTGGFELWDECMKGNKKSWEKMIKYCCHDVRLLERLYKAIRPFIPNHPNMNLYDGYAKDNCPSCGKDALLKRGFALTTTGKYQRFVCARCGKWARGDKRISAVKVKAV